MIRISDIGVGMNHDDALLSIERYATSKIFTDQDLFSINTLGFRGEALPSIASVPKFSIVTRDEFSEVGTEIDVEGGRVVRDRVIRHALIQGYAQRLMKGCFAIKNPASEKDAGFSFGRITLSAARIEAQVYDTLRKCLQRLLPGCPPPSIHLHQGRRKWPYRSGYQKFSS